MTGWLLGFVSIIYIITAFTYLYQSNIGMFIVFMAYALGNLGLYIAGLK